MMSNTADKKMRLNKPKATVKAKLQKQIDSGEEILKRPLNNANDLQLAKDTDQLWYEYTQELLLHLFVGEEVKEEFAWAVSAFWPGQDFSEPLNARLTKLQSFMQRVDLCEEYEAPSSVMSEPGDESLNKKKVFVVHGRNRALTDSMFDFLRAIGLEPIEWSQAIALTKKATPYIQDIVATAFKEAQAVVVLLSGDDLVMLRSKFIERKGAQYEKDLTPQARPNVLFEAGMAMAGSQQRTILVQVGTLRPFSDIQGLHITNLDNSPEKRQELATKLQSAGCDTGDISAKQRWMSVGDFQDQLDSHEADINKPQSRPAVSTLPKVTKKRLPLMQAESLLDRMKRERAVKDGTLADEFLDEYLNILDRAVSEWEGNDALIDLQKKGKLYPTMHFPPYSIDRLKWSINAVEKLVVIMESFG